MLTRGCGYAGCTCVTVRERDRAMSDEAVRVKPSTERDMTSEKPLWRLWQAAVVSDFGHTGCTVQQLMMKSAFLKFAHFGS